MREFSLSKELPLSSPERTHLLS